MHSTRYLALKVNPLTSEASVHSRAHCTHMPCGWRGAGVEDALRCAFVMPHAPEVKHTVSAEKPGLRLNLTWTDLSSS
eukprot:2715465-Rhodomonas_salina.1